MPTGLPGGVERVEIVKRIVAERHVPGRVDREPPFKLQGSYRNMVKLAAQLSPLMTDVGGGRKPGPECSFASHGGANAR